MDRFRFVAALLLSNIEGGNNQKLKKTTYIDFSSFHSKVPLTPPLQKSPPCAISGRLCNPARVQLGGLFINEEWKNNQTFDAHGQRKFNEGKYSQQCGVKAKCWHILQGAAHKQIGVNRIMLTWLLSPSFTTRYSKLNSAVLFLPLSA